MKIDKDKIADTASFVGNVAKTFILTPQHTKYPVTEEAPAPEPKTPSVTDDWYKAYGRYAPYKPGRSKARHKRGSK